MNKPATHDGWPDVDGPVRRSDLCDRCRKPMTSRIVSYFSEEMICMACLAAERRLLVTLRARGADLGALAGCGYLPRLGEERSAVPRRAPARKTA